ncbi:MAG: amino acid permease [Candidatus Tyrphobacter sp.]
MAPQGGMERAISTRGAVAVNVITMVGIGPLITIPLVLASLGGPLALVGWIGGAVVALCDGLVWAELSSRFPASGGTYVYLREAFGARRLGRALAFLFNWQFLLFAPFVLASGYVGFADYTAYLAPGMSAWLPNHLCAIGVGIVTIVLLMRKTTKVSATGLVLGIVAVFTLAFIALAALTHANWHAAMRLPGPVRLGNGFLAGFGSALFVTLYDYVGYSQVALLGDEVRNPARTIPRAIVISILLVAVLYVALQVGVLGVVPWRSLFDAHGSPTAASFYVGAIAVQKTWGVAAARAVTVLVLITAFASVYGNLLGASRIPFAAARDGAFFKTFARLHPTKHIPALALLVIGGLSLLASLFPLDEIIAILTAGIVLVQSVMQIVALFVLRSKGAPPFRMPLYPLPAVVALGGWVLAFCFTGATAISIGVAWLIVGGVVYLLVAKVQRAWPFAAAAVACALVFLAAPRVATAAPVGAWRTWSASRIVRMNGDPVFDVDGRPFFVYGASFFYERLPADAWRRSLLAYRSELHINTIDLYVPWNWHEPTQGHLDFTGASNPRRNLIGLLQTITHLGFKIVLRPGPVIRNEWRNGGYPAWLLRRPAYDMPLHDILEGRYPATATLQNRHADAASAEWLKNRTHLHYAANWLREVLTAVAPFSHDVIAIALDDDQGAYLDNDTWPAPHWHAYVEWLRRQVHSITGSRVPIFVNTYEMKVTADSPAWAWGDWYQSSAYRIGAHDREQIDFSTDLLGTQPHVPIMMAEFQAGWLQGADENAPRPADPTNTALALSEFLADGAHGIVNFPVQDSIYPAGWEVPWANWAYDWDAALTACLECAPSKRFWPTAHFGAEIARYGSLLATTHPVVDAHVVWPPSLFPAASEGARAENDAAVTLAMLKECRERGLICDLRDLRYEPLSADGAPYILPIVLDGTVALNATAQRRLRDLRRQRRLAASLATVASRGFSGEHDGATLLLDDAGRSGFVVASNWRSRRVRAGPYFVRLGRRIVRLPSLQLAPRSARLIPLRESRHSSARTLQHVRVYKEGEIFLCVPAFFFGTGWWPLEVTCSARTSNVLRYDPFEDGFGAIEMRSGRTTLVLAPDAGARVACLCDRSGSNFAATIGLLRDAVDPEPTPSSRDYIAAFTHPIPGGTFNRRYFCATARAGEATAEVTCEYRAPDLPTGGAYFERALAVDSQHGEIDISERMTPFDRTSNAHLKSISGFAVNDGDAIEEGAACFGVYRASLHELARLCWRAQDVFAHDVRRTRGAAILTLHFKTNDIEMRLGVLAARSQAMAGAIVEDAPTGHANSARYGEVAER